MKELIYSRNAVYEALVAKRRQFFSIEIAEGVQEKGKLAEILKLAQENKIKVNRVPRPKLDKIHQNNQGIVAEVSGYPYSDVVDILEHAKGELPFVLMLDSLQDPQNFGTLIRTAEALGVHGVVIPTARTVDVTPAVVNASSGASEHMLIAQANLSQTIDALKENDVWVVGLDQAGAEIEAGSRHLKGALGLVVGSEGEGLHDLVRKKCDIVLKLPMRGKIESLNAAVAGSVALYLAYFEIESKGTAAPCPNGEIMPQATYHFPKGFLWGTATASHQVEGNNTNNNWYAWEEAGHTVHKSGLAADWWGGRWREDFDRAAETGQNAHRFSLEWSRIQPTPDSWDEEAIEKYRHMLRGLKERNMTALVTLHHFTDPLWVSEKGGWENNDIVLLFEKFTRKVVDALKEYVTLWCTINEPNVYALGGYAQGVFPPGKQNLKLSFRVLGNMIRGHAAAYRAIHELQPEARVGYALHYRPMVPQAKWSPLDRLMRKIRYDGINIGFPSAISTGVMKSIMGNQNIPEAKGTQDYLGLNYYSVDVVRFNITKHKELFSDSSFAKDADMSDNNFIANVPEGIFSSIKWIERTYPHLPIIITENGVEDSDDHMRPRYLAQHLHQVWRAVNFNWPVKGYFHWSLVDNFEWERGWTQRFGLWGLDLDTQKRIRRPSVDLYAEICKENGISSEMVQKYCPEVFEKIFPS